LNPIFTVSRRKRQRMRGAALCGRRRPPLCRTCAKNSNDTIVRCCFNVQDQRPGGILITNFAAPGNDLEDMQLNSAPSSNRCLSIGPTAVHIAGLPPRWRTVLALRSRFPWRNVLFAAGAARLVSRGLAGLSDNLSIRRQRHIASRRTTGRGAR